MLKRASHYRLTYQSTLGKKLCIYRRPFSAHVWDFRSLDLVYHARAILTVHDPKRRTQEHHQVSRPWHRKCRYPRKHHHQLKQPFNQSKVTWAQRRNWPSAFWLLQNHALLQCFRPNPIILVPKKDGGTSKHESHPVTTKLAETPETTVLSVLLGNDFCRR